MESFVEIVLVDNILEILDPKSKNYPFEEDIDETPDIQFSNLVRTYSKLDTGF